MTVTNIADHQPHAVDIYVGQQVRQHREARGYTQSDLAKALDLTFQQIQKYERGVNRISASKLFLMAMFFKVEVGVFFPDGSSDVEATASGTDLMSQIMAVRAFDLVKTLPTLSQRSLAAVKMMVNQLAALEQGKTESEADAA